MVDKFSDFDKEQYSILMAGGERGRLVMMGAFDKASNDPGLLRAVIGVYQDRGKDEVTGKDILAVLPLGYIFREAEAGVHDFVPFLGDNPTKIVNVITKDEFIHSENSGVYAQAVGQLKELMLELVQTMEAFAEAPTAELADTLEAIRAQGVALGAITQEQAEEFNRTTREVVSRSAFIKQFPIKVDASADGEGIKDAVMAIDLSAHDCENCDGTDTCPPALQEAIRLLKEHGETEETRTKLNNLLSSLIGKPVQMQRKQ